MGDRANIVVKQPNSNEAIYLYSHWGGYRMPQVLQAALKRGESRWDDHAYLTRIIFCELIQNDVMETTGFGISTSVQDNEYPFLILDTEKREVSFVSKRTEEPPHLSCNKYRKKMSFENFCKLEFGDNDSWEVLIKDNYPDD